MTIAIADRPRFGRRPGHAADAVRAKILALDSGDTHVLESVVLASAGCLIDHLVIGPAGVFTVSVHEDPAREVHIDHYGMTLDGLAVPYLRQAKFQAEQIARALRGPASADVAVFACAILTGTHVSQVHYESRPNGVVVLGKSDVPRWFHRQSMALDTEQVRAVFELARRLPAAPKRAPQPLRALRRT